jgi:predicted phage terminase large subunit-like protein
MAATVYRLPKVKADAGEVVIAPQAGPQTRFLASSADIVVYGGAAGGGKSYALLLDALRDAALKPVKGFSAVIFRRTSPQITQAGGLWETSTAIYPLANGKPRQTPWLGWEWPANRTSIRFTHLQHETDKFSHQGGQYPYIGFDELTHFTESQFFYLLSRNRSPHGAKARIRATTNPDPDSWVKSFLAPWVDRSPQYLQSGAITADSGQVLWMHRNGDAIEWYRSKADAPEAARKHLKSVTFIEARLSDNPALLLADPNYLSNLLAMPPVDRERLLGGPLAWSIRAEGNTFKRRWFPIVEHRPEGLEWVRYWDRAATKPSESNKDPDYTVGTLVGLNRDEHWYCIADVVRLRDTPHEVERAIRRTAEQDGKSVAVVLEQEPGASGVAEVAGYYALLDGWVVDVVKPTGSKLERAKPFASQAEAGNIRVVRASWLHDWLGELEAFPNPRVHDDQVDSASGGFAWVRDNAPPSIRFFDEPRRSILDLLPRIE